MIRRNSPLGSEPPDHYLLIPQQEHARISYELASAWGNDKVAPLICPAEESDHPLYGVREEFLAAMLHHDDGWAKWWDEPGIDPEHNRPYSFTEMPPAEAQKLWRASIDACRQFGPLAGWVVASHFSWLQSKVDDDYDQWKPWLAEVDAERAPWLEEWLASSEFHTQELADRCLDWLQAFDWMSLWLCCKCPASTETPVEVEPLRVGTDDSLSEVTFMPNGQELRVRPWAFGVERLEIDCPAFVWPKDAGTNSHDAAAIRIRWRLA